MQEALEMLRSAIQPTDMLGSFELNLKEAEDLFRPLTQEVDTVIASKFSATLKAVEKSYSEDRERFNGFNSAFYLGTPIDRTLFTNISIQKIDSQLRSCAELVLSVKLHYEEARAILQNTTQVLKDCQKMGGYFSKNNRSMPVGQ